MNDLNLALIAAKKASIAIMKCRKNGFETRLKPDKSIVTSADIVANEIICEILSKSGTQIYSEESLNLGTNDTFWLIDPLDGTKYYAKNRDNFCILIVLISQNRPVLGVLGIPAYDNFMSCDGKNIFVNGKNLERFRIDITPNLMFLNSEAKNIGTLRKKFALSFRSNVIKFGSGIKFYKLTLGSAGIFISQRVSHSWDIALGDLLVNASGGKMVDFNGNLLSYKAPTLQNPHFLALSRENAANADKYLEFMHENL